jgi:hypothetical protein
VSDSLKQGICITIFNTGFSFFPYVNLVLIRIGSVEKDQPTPLFSGQERKDSYLFYGEWNIRKTQLDVKDFTRIQLIKGTL